MGLIHTIGVILSLCILVFASSCVKEISLASEENPSYFFIDGNIVINDDVQQIKIGRTEGVATATPSLIRGATVMVKNFTDQEEYLFQEISGGEYRSNFRGKLNKKYQLSITFQSGQSFITDTLTLLDSPSLVFSGDVVPKVRVSSQGDSVLTNIATANVDFQTPVVPSNDLLVVRSKFEYAISDLVCNPFDSASKCYFKDDITIDKFGLIDLSRFGSSESGTFQVGGYGIDARMAEESVIIVEIFRADEQAKPYYRSIASSVELSGNFFSPQPLTIPGNLIQDQGGSSAALGYFGVIERTTLVLPARSNEIKDRAGLAYCEGGSANFMQWDCCFCFLNEGSSSARPSYWP